jgi:hypothetical protein
MRNEFTAPAAVEIADRADIFNSVCGALNGGREHAPAEICGLNAEDVAGPKKTTYSIIAGANPGPRCAR